MGITNLGKLITNNEEVYSDHTHATKPNFINSYFNTEKEGNQKHKYIMNAQWQAQMRQKLTLSSKIPQSRDDQFSYTFLVIWLQTLSNKNKVSKGKQKEIATSGAQTFAQISDDMVRNALQVLLYSCIT